MTTRTLAQSEAWARNQVVHPSRIWTGYCLVFTRECWNILAKYGDAVTHWNHVPAAHKHTTGTPPKGAAVQWGGGSAGHGHIAYSLGGGYCASTDIRRTGKVDIVPISEIHSRWGLPYLGWTDWINGVVVPVAKPAPQISVHLANLKPERGGTKDPGAVTDIKHLQNGLIGRHYAIPAGATGYYGAQTRAAVAAFQHDHFPNDPADGIVGRRSLEIMGFKVL